MAPARREALMRAAREKTNRYLLSLLTFEPPTHLSPEELADQRARKLLGQ